MFVVWGLVFRVWGLGFSGLGLRLSTQRLGGWGVGSDDVRGLVARWLGWINIEKSEGCLREILDSYLGFRVEGLVFRV